MKASGPSLKRARCLASLFVAVPFGGITACGTDPTGASTGSGTTDASNPTTATGDPASADTTNTCPVAEEGCPCSSLGNCHPGLACEDEVCVAIDCEPGEEGCECGLVGTCEDDLVCLGNAGSTCVNDICIETCIPGTKDCVCDEGECWGGLDCVDELCVPSEDGTSGTTDTGEVTTGSTGNAAETGEPSGTTG